MASNDADVYQLEPIENFSYIFSSKFVFLHLLLFIVIYFFFLKKKI